MLSNIKSYVQAKQVAAAQAKAKVEQQKSIEAKATAYAENELLTDQVKEALSSEYYLGLKTKEANARTLEMTEKAHKAAKVNQEALDKLEVDLDVIYTDVVIMQDRAETLREETKAIKADITKKMQATKSLSVADRIAAARAKNAPKTI